MPCIEFIHRPDGRDQRITVKNLGFLIAKAGKIGVSDVQVTDTELTVYYSNGDEHRSTWADPVVMADWLRSRRSWYGTPLHFNGKDGVIGKAFPQFVRASA